MEVSGTSAAAIAATAATGAALRELLKVVQEATALPERDERPKVQRQRRPGWAMPLVREVLREATGIGPGSSFRRTKRAFPNARCARAPARVRSRWRALCVMRSMYRGQAVETDFWFTSRSVGRIDIYFR